MFKQIRIRVPYLGVLSVCVATILVSGCATFKPADKQEMPVGQSSGQPVGTYTVEFRDVFGSGKPYVGKIDEKNPWVQTALEDSGAWKRYRSMNIIIERKVPGRYQPLEIPVEVQPRKREVKYEQDYALLPGDKVIVSPKSTNPIVQMLEGDEADR